MKTHELKCWPVFFADVWAGRKTSELRQDDRGFEAGDMLRQREYDPDDGSYSGRATRQKITHVIRGPVFGLADGWVVLSTVLLGKAEGGGS